MTLEMTLQPLQVLERIRDVLRTNISGAKDTAQDEGSLEGAQATSVALADPANNAILIQPDDDEYRPQRLPAIWVQFVSMVPGNKTLTDDRSTMNVRVRCWFGAPARPTSPNDPSLREDAARAALGFVSAVVSVLEQKVVGTVANGGVFACHVDRVYQARPLQEGTGTYVQIYDIDVRCEGQRRHSRGL